MESIMPVVAAEDLKTKVLYRKVILKIIPYIFVCYLFNYLDRVNVGFAKLHMLDALGMSEAAYGLGAGIFFIGYLCFGLPSNLAIQRFGARRWIAIIMILWGALSSCLMFVQTAESFYVIRFFTGAAEAGFFPGLILYFTRWFPASVRGRVMALFMSAIPLSGVLGGPLSGWILDVFSTHPVAGLAAWQWLFLIEGIPTIFLGIGVYFILDDRIEDAKWLTTNEKSILLSELAKDELKNSKSDGLKEVMKSKTVWLLGLIYFSFQGGVYAISFWLPTVVKAGNWGSMLMVGVITAIPYAAATLFMIFMGKSADINNERRWHLAVPMIMSAVGLMIAANSGGSSLLALFGLTIATMGAFTALPMFWPLSSSYLSVSAAVAGVAIINSVGQIAGFASPYFVGWIKDTTHSTDLAWYSLSLLTLAGAIVMLLMSRQRKAQ
ncbi:MFS transporter [Pseudomonas umsongensis]|uniref:MFS transporter n=1 Tax=Pseudomonas umsongensis TaxID=198618 RepID=UPI003D7FB125